MGTEFKRKYGPNSESKLLYMLTPIILNLVLAASSEGEDHHRSITPFSKAEVAEKFRGGCGRQMSSCSRICGSRSLGKGIPSTIVY